MRRLILLRHGESTWNREGRLQGQTMEVPLTPLGLRQAHEAAERVAALTGVGTPVWSSDQLRARQTAEVVAARLEGRLETSGLLREQALGDMEGVLSSELTAQPVPDGKDISEIRWGGGESVADVHARSRAFLDSLPEMPRDVVIVGHGDSLRVLLAVVEGRSHRDVDYSFTFANATPVSLPWPGGEEG